MADFGSFQMRAASAEGTFHPLKAGVSCHEHEGSLTECRSSSSAPIANDYA